MKRASKNAQGTLEFLILACLLISAWAAALQGFRIIPDMDEAVEIYNRRVHEAREQEYSIPF
jgi:hypothetical protein